MSGPTKIAVLDDASHVVTTAAQGFMSAADKSKLDGVAASSAALASTTPAAVSTAGAVGTGTTAARSDHVHANNIVIASTTPAAVGTAAVGTSGTAARSDHVHAHGNQLGGSLHANAVSASTAGFMTGADKALLDSLVASPVGVLQRAITAGDATATFYDFTFPFTVTSFTVDYRSSAGAPRVACTETATINSGKVRVSVGTGVAPLIATDIVGVAASSTAAL